MSGRDLTRDERCQLESLIDGAGLCAMLQALSQICDEKADHIRTNWQDKHLAKSWNSAAGVIGVAACNGYIQAIGEP